MLCQTQLHVNPVYLAFLKHKGQLQGKWHSGRTNPTSSVCCGLTLFFVARAIVLEECIVPFSWCWRGMVKGTAPTREPSKTQANGCLQGIAISQSVPSKCLPMLAELAKFAKHVKCTTLVIFCRTLETPQDH